MKEIKDKCEAYKNELAALESYEQGGRKRAFLFEGSHGEASAWLTSRKRRLARIAKLSKKLELASSVVLSATPSSLVES